MNKKGLFQECDVGLIFENHSVQHHMNTIKKKNHMFFPAEEKNVNKIQIPD